MPIQQTRFIHCTKCGKVIKTEIYGDARTPSDLRKLFGLQRKQRYKDCK